MNSPDVNEESTPVLQERRQNPRQRLGRLATIKLGVGIAPRFVLVTNTSVEGVRLRKRRRRLGVVALIIFVLCFSFAPIVG